MNKYSYICRLIKENPNDWRAKLETLSVRTKEDYPLAIFNYEQFADFTNPIVREARGIIIRLDTLDVVCWPFTKFCNLHEDGAKIDLENFDWEHCRFQEKIDGSIVKLFYNSITTKWQWSTNSCICSDEATLSTCLDKSFTDTIKKADNHKDISFSELNKNTTYIFELVSPQTQMVIKYPNEHLYHIGTRNNLTGQELDVYIGVEKPKEFPLHSLDDCIRAAKEINKGKNEVVQEGFVIVDRFWHRIKVKSPEYLEMHRISSNNSFQKKRIINLIRSGETTAEELSRNYPLYEVYFRYYDYKMKELEWNISRFILYARALYDEYNHEIHAVADQIKEMKYAAFAFDAINYDKTAKQMLDEMPLRRYCKWIPDYEPEKLY